MQSCSILSIFFFVITVSYLVNGGDFRSHLLVDNQTLVYVIIGFPNTKQLTFGLKIRMQFSITTLGVHLKAFVVL